LRFGWGLREGLAGGCGLDSYFEDVGGLGLRLAILAFGLAFHEEIEVGGDDSVEPGFSYREMLLMALLCWR